MRSRSSRRSASVSAEWSTATRSPKRARKRPTVCGVSAISGTSTITPRSRASAAAAAWRYTSVFPLPVGPCSRTWPPSASSAATIRSTLERCSGVSSAGSGSPPSASRAAGSRRAPRRASVEGRDERERARRRRAVVVGDPERELDERRGHAVDDGACIGDLDAGGRVRLRRRRRPRGRAVRRARWTRRRRAPRRRGRGT